MSILLKILTGSHMGAEIELTQGDWKIGSDVSNDIVLLDATIVCEHALLSVEETEVSISPQNGEVLVNGLLINNEKQKIPFFTPFSIGGVYLCVGPANRAWEKYEVPTLSSIEEQAKLMAEKNFASKEEQEEPALALDKESTKPQNVLEKKRGKKVLLPFLGIVLLLLLVVGIRGYLSEDAKAVIQNLLNNPTYSEVRLEQKNDEFILCGFVAKDQDIVYLENIIQGLDTPTGVYLFSVEQVKDGLRNIIDELGVLWSLQTRQKKLRVSGYIYDLELANAIINPLKMELTFISPDFSLTYWEDMEATMLEQLGRRGLLPKIFIYPSAYKIGIATLILTPEEEKFLAEVLLEIEDQFIMLNPFVRLPNIPSPKVTPSKTINLIKFQLPLIELSSKFKRLRQEIPMECSPKESSILVSQNKVVQQKSSDLLNFGMQDSTRSESINTEENENLKPSNPKLLDAKRNVNALGTQLSTREHGICEKIYLKNTDKGLAASMDSQLYGQGERLPNGWFLEELQLEYVVLTLKNQMKICNPSIK